jgi:cytochrome c553
MNDVSQMLRSIFLWIASSLWVVAVEPCFAAGDTAVPAWLFPLSPPAPDNAAPADAVKALHLPNSKAAFTEAQLNDFFSAPDWFPDSHSIAPAIVMRGNPPAVFACGYCHSPSGQGRPENASLAGLPASYIVQQVAAIKNGLRHSAWNGAFLPSELMVSVAKNVSEEEVGLAAQYFSAQRLMPRVTVIEQARVPVTHVAGWVYVANEGSAMEPLAGRILELAPDMGRHEKRDDSMRYVAYVPPGSIGRGRTMAITGSNGLTTACVSCHGGSLVGVGLVPPLAGRSPTYLLRQLLAFQTGARAGAASIAMQTVVEDLKLNDLVDVAAYAASLPPAAN